METCSSPWHPWTSCLDYVERCDSGYCALTLGILMLVGLTIFSSILICAAVITALPTFRYSKHSVKILRGTTFVLMVLSLGIITAGTVFEHM